MRSSARLLNTQMHNQIKISVRGRIVRSSGNPKNGRSRWKQNGHVACLFCSSLQIRKLLSCTASEEYTMAMPAQSRMTEHTISHAQARCLSFVHSRKSAHKQRPQCQVCESVMSIFHAFNSPVSCQSGALETCSNLNSATPSRSTTWRNETNICRYFPQHRISFKDAQTPMSSARISSNYARLRVTNSLCTKVTRRLLSTRNNWWRRRCCDGYKSTTHTKSGTACYASDITSTNQQHQHRWRCGNV